MSREDLRKVARRVADQLHDDLRREKITVIGIDVIRGRLRGETRGLSLDEREELESMTVRRVVEKC